MERRDFLAIGGAALAAAAVSDSGVAQRPTSKPAAPAQLRLDAYSRTLHWLRTPGEVAEACHQIGNTSIDLTVRPGSGHVDPAQVATALPAFVNGLRAGGIEVSMIAPNILDADDEYAEATLDAASSLGIHHYWWGTYRYDVAQPYWPQLDALKPKVEAIAKLNEKYGMKGMAHPRDGAASVSAAFFDLLDVLKNFDPRWVSFQYDTHHLLQAYDGGWVQQLRLGTPYIGGFVWKDVMIEESNSPNPDDAWRAAHPSPARRGRGGFPGGARGRGGHPAAPTRTRIRQVPVGTGMINLALIAQTLKEIQFNGPMECEPEWPQLDGASQGATELTIPRAQAIALLRRDHDTMMGLLTAANLV